MPELRCVKVDDHYILRDGAAGIFLAASQFPKHRETRAPTVAELKPHSNEINPKYHYLLEAPETDPHGNPASIKYSRKTREQFVASESDGKPTGWRATYRERGSKSAVQGSGRALEEARAGARAPAKRGRKKPKSKRAPRKRAPSWIMREAMDEQSDAFAMLEIVQLSNGDIVLRDPDDGAEPLLRIQFSREVRTLLGTDAMQVAKLMIEAAASKMSAMAEANDAVDGDARHRSLILRKRRVSGGG